MRWTKHVIALAVAILLAFATYQRFESASSARKISRLEEETGRLMRFVERLSASRRVAQVSVLEERRNEQGWPVKRLLWQDIDDDGIVTAPAYLEVVGDVVYVEAFVVKFKSHLVAEASPGRDKSLALFRRVFGDRQAPESAPPLTRTVAERTLVTEGPPTAESRLWEQFWDLMDSPDVAEQLGVRVAQCEAVGVNLRAGQVWEVTLDADGGLNLRKVRDAGRLANWGTP